MIWKEELAFIKAISTIRPSPALLRELRVALSRRKKKPVVLAGSIRQNIWRLGQAPQDHLDSSRASVKSTSRQARASHSSQLIGAQRLALGPHLCPRVHRQSRAKKLLPETGNSGLLIEGRRTWLLWQDPSPCLSQVGRSSPQPWVLTSLNPLSHPRQPTGAYLATCPGL